MNAKSSFLPMKTAYFWKQFF